MTKNEMVDRIQKQLGSDGVEIEVPSDTIESFIDDFDISMVDEFIELINNYNKIIEFSRFWVWNRTVENSFTKDEFQFRIGVFIKLNDIPYGSNELFEILFNKSIIQYDYKSMLSKPTVFCFNKKILMKKIREKKLKGLGY